MTRNTGAQKPGCAWLCSDSMRPKCRKSKTESGKSELDSPKANIISSKHPKCCRGRKNSKLLRSNTKTDEPRHAMPRAGNKGPVTTKSRRNRKKSQQTAPTVGKNRAIRDMDLTKRAEPNSVLSKVEGNGSSHARPRKSITNPR